MTNQEFSNEFDILYNNIASNQAPGLDEYEKSVFLTKAQDAIVLELFSGKNVFGDSFEKTEEVRQYLSNIVKTTTLSKTADTSIKKLSEKSIIYDKPEDLWFTIYENIEFDNSNMPCVPSSSIEVVPVTHDEFSKINKNPFRKASYTRVLKLDVSNKIELVSNYDISTYNIRYIKTLNPIILLDLPVNLSIKEKSEFTECELNPALHTLILERAVEMAKISMGLVESGK